MDGVPIHFVGKMARMKEKKDIEREIGKRVRKRERRYRLAKCPDNQCTKGPEILGSTWITRTHQALRNVL
jgi:hypothetical protein